MGKPLLAKQLQERLVDNSAPTTQEIHQPPRGIPVRGEQKRKNCWTGLITSVKQIATALQSSRRLHGRPICPIAALQPSGARAGDLTSNRSFRRRSDLMASWQSMDIKVSAVDVALAL
jgi:hypothetical protein